MQGKSQSTVTLLAVDTTSRRESVAVLRADQLLGAVHLECPDTHSRRVLPAAAFLLQTLGLGPQDLDGFAVAVGPGSFTGLRVGLSTVQGLALGTGRPCVGVSALDAVAWQARGTGATLAVMLDAGRGEVFAGLYSADGTPQGAGSRAAPRAFVEQAPSSSCFVGEGAWRYGDVVRAAHPQARVLRGSEFLAEAVGRIGVQRLASGEGRPAASLRPLYLREVHIRGRDT